VQLLLADKRLQVTNAAPLRTLPSMRLSRGSNRRCTMLVLLKRARAVHSVEGSYTKVTNVVAPNKGSTSCRSARQVTVHYGLSRPESSTPHALALCHVARTGEQYFIGAARPK